jgi:cytochrome c-type biogenesis protein CcmH/NrfF
MKVRKFKRISTFNNALILSFVWVTVFLVACFLFATTHAQTESQNPQNAQFESQLKELLTTVYCYCGCQRETIESCVCGTAGRIENDFRNQLLAGQTVEQIRTNYLDTYGPQFYAVMPAEGINLIAYIMPVVILALIGGVAFTVLRKSKQEPATTTDGGGVSKQQVTDTTLKQVETELERYKREK